MTRKDIKKLELKAEYRTLSRATEFFPRTSIHKAFIHMNKRMDDILTELENLK